MGRSTSFLLIAFGMSMLASGCGASATQAADAARDDASGPAIDAATPTDAALGEDASVRHDAGATDAASPPDGACGRPDASMGPTDVMCAATPPVFPIFDRSCCTDSDCAVVRHQIDCCGSYTQTGVSSSIQAGFQTAEMLCESQYPRCRCLARPDVANDDSSAVTSTDLATVHCITRVCQTTFVR